MPITPHRPKPAEEPPRPRSEEYLTQNDVAALLRVSVKTIVNRRNRGDSLPQSFRIGRRILFRRADVDRWINAQRRASRSA